MNGAWVIFTACFAVSLVLGFLAASAAINRWFR